MPSTRSLRLAVLVALGAIVAMTACDSVNSPSASPSATSSTQAGRCEGADLQASGIDGRVVDEAGDPLNDILILIETPGGFVGETRTGEEGVFQTSGVTGEFVISTVDIDYEGSPRRITVECGETLDVELVLTPVGG